MNRILAALAVLACATFARPAGAQEEITLRIHHFLPATAVTAANFIEPWARKVEAESGGRIRFEIYPAMQLGGAPPALYDQAREGVADIIWTLLGYTPGRFPKAEVFDLPFIATTGEATSGAAWAFYEKHLTDEFSDVKVIAFHTHSPGLLHVKGEGVRSLEDMEGLKLRGPTRMITRLLESLGAVAVGMPVPQVPEAVSKGVIDGAALPWEVTRPLRLAELLDTHTDFSGDRSLYVTSFVFAMNKARYESLPDDLKKVIDDNSGAEASLWAGRAHDEGDMPAIEAARGEGNTFITLDEEETARWKQASERLIDEWIGEMDALGHDGRQLVEDARALIEQHGSAE